MVRRGSQRSYARRLVDSVVLFILWSGGAYRREDKGNRVAGRFFFCDCVFAGLLVGLLLQPVLGRRRCSLLIEPTAWSCP